MGIDNAIYIFTLGVKISSDTHTSDESAVDGMIT